MKNQPRGNIEKQRETDIGTEIDIQKKAGTGNAVAKTGIETGTDTVKKREVREEILEVTIGFIIFQILELFVSSMLNF